MNQNNKIFYNCMGLLGFILFVLLDQWTKYLAIAKLAPLGQEGYSLISGILKLQYLENRGAAFGILQNQQWFFLLLTGIFLIAAVIFFIICPKSKRFLALNIVVVALSAGAVGNMIDRIQYRYVVDFIYVSCIDFPIFNVADIYVTCGAIVLFILILFVYKDEEFDFLKRRIKK